MTATEVKPTLDPRLAQPLARLRGLLRRHVVIDGLLAAALVVVAWLLAGLALDYGVFLATNTDWVQDAPPAVRGLGLATAGVALLGVLVLRIGRRLFADLSDTSLSLVLEKRFPGVLGERLITAVELADEDRAARQGYSRDMVRRTAADARERLDRVPVEKVLNRKRLWKQAGVVAAGCVLLLAAVVAAGIAFTRVPTAAGVLHGTADVAAIWAERNVFLRNTPWPRAAYLDVLEPTAGEYRVGRDAGPPRVRVRVRAAEWVIADRDAHAGWRPLAWADLTPAFVGVAVPETVMTTEEGDDRPEDVARAAVVGALTMPAERRQVVKTHALATLAVDEVGSAYGREGPLAEVFTALDAKAADPAYGRALRRLDAPGEVTLRYAGLPKSAGKVESLGTRGDVRLTRDPSGDFSAEVSGLKESVGYTVRARNFRTDPRRIVLVPPPMLTRLSRTESQPAYLTHPAPVDAAGKSVPLTADQLQVLAPKQFSLTGDRSVAAMPAGTAFTLTGVADKPLSQVIVNPKAGRLPGVDDPAASLSLTPQGDTFTLTFAGRDRVTSNLEFELVLVDEDGVRTRRPVMIQVTEDQPPQVEVAVDVLRKVGSAYMVTPRARVPFVKESIVRDDTGLTKVEYQFEVTRLEAQAVVALQLQAAAGVFAASPALPGIGALVAPVASATVAGSLAQGGQKQFGSLTVPAFERSYAALPKSTVAGLAAKLAVPPADPDSPNVVREVKFTLDGDAFDLETADSLLEKQGRRMRVGEFSGDVQPRFRLEMNVIAADGNVVSGPKTGQNLEPLRFTVVSEADLLGEITKDEEAITGRFDEALKNLRTGQAKLEAEAARLGSAEIPPDILRAAEFRAADIAQHVAKCRDFVQGVAADYMRLRKEVETNRCNEAVPKRYQAVIITPIEQVLAAEQKAAEVAVEALREPLKEGRKPPEAAVAQTRTALAALLKRLEAIRRELGDTLSEGKLRDDLRKIIENQTLVSNSLDGIMKRNREMLFAPEVRPVPAIELAVGASKKVTQEIDWKLFDKGELKLRLSVTPAGGPTVPADITVTDDKNEFSYTVTAGAKPGTYTLKITPSVGPPVTIPVTVK
jgi:hypothetical protein